ncbi:hypothetical protein OGAPHI_000650 [Ogataea philodendri]|uniref:Uncharacterized protein n=1 Tax=Ogataea philodendri TaxID=1378263 RepID=A0A9P8T9U6_9ASCO|nr:uncharacterized protein OGAPHI_000650 [Ogataea philodendri]KAH3670939.1 hypothetical protein OGAPHI_000650 [Ogataea philodendri]
MLLNPELKPSRLLIPVTQSPLVRATHQIPDLTFSVDGTFFKESELGKFQDGSNMEPASETTWISSPARSLSCGIPSIDSLAEHSCPARSLLLTTTLMCEIDGRIRGLKESDLGQTGVNRIQGTIG